MTALVLLSYEENQIRSTSRSTIAAAKKFGEVHALLVGHNLSELSQKAAKLEGVTKVLVADHEAYAHMLAQPVTDLVLSIAEAYDYILVSANAEGKDILPRVAGLLDVQPITDVVEIVNENTFVRPIYAGSILATVKSSDNKKLLSIRGTAFEPVSDEGGQASIEVLSKVAHP